MAPDSKVETFAALRLEVDSWRWKGVPFYIRAGKNLPVTCTEVLARFREAPTVIAECATSRNYLRFRISPEMVIAFGATVMGSDETMKGEKVEIVASSHPRPEEMEAYERVLGDAMAGDARHFAREDYVEEAWRIVDPVLKAETPPSTSTRRARGDPARPTRRSCRREAGITPPRRHTIPTLSPTPDESGLDTDRENGGGDAPPPCNIPSCTNSHRSDLGLATPCIPTEVIAISLQRGLILG